MTFRFALLSSAVALAFGAAGTAQAQSLSNASFVNGIAIAGNSLDLSTGSDFDRRVGFFSDIYYDNFRSEWWGLSDRGPGGGTLPYETRVQRFTLDVASNGAISNFKIQQTVKFANQGTALNGIAPSPTSQLGNAFDPEGFVINPKNGNLLVSDEYGPSVYEFDRSGALVRTYATPSNLVPRNAATGVANYAGDTGNTAGKRTNRGFEGLAISPDGQYAYAMLQSAMLDEGGGDGSVSRIVKFDTATGLAVAQYAYQMDRSGQGQGTSSLVALGNDKFLVLERNNRGVGVGATLATADKSVYQIDLAGATDVSDIDLDAAGAVYTKVTKGAKVIDLDADTLAALGGKSPEKWEGLAVGPKLANGQYLILAGTDNDYSVTQDATSGVQSDVYFRMTDADPYAGAIFCPIGQTTGCSATLTADYTLLPGVLHAYTADIAGYVTAVPEPQTYALMLAGLAFVGAAARAKRRRA